MGLSTPRRALLTAATNSGSLSVASKEREALGRQAGRRDVGPRELLPCQHQVEGLTVELGLDLIDDQRNIRKIRILVIAVLDDDRDLAILDPVRLLGLEIAPGVGERA